jgi:hypothetical protein
VTPRCFADAVLRHDGDDGGSYIPEACCGDLVRCRWNSDGESYLSEVCRRDLSFGGGGG